MQDEAYTLRSLTLFVSSHFMFNVLAKLQSEILSGDKKEAISTLSEYSELFRLANSIALCENISLSQEELFLGKYLSLEQKRFTDTPVEFDLKGFKEQNGFIVPFIIQPFLELAVLGSLQKSGSKVMVEYHPKDHQISIGSILMNHGIRQKMNEKLQIAQKRIEFFEYSYEMLEKEGRFLQKINISV